MNEDLEEMMEGYGYDSEAIIDHLFEEVTRLDKYTVKREEYVEFLVKQIGELQSEISDLQGDVKDLERRLNSVARY